MTEYVTLNLTKPSDRLPALAGIAHQFQAAGMGMYLSGLWQKSLSRDLAWRPHFAHEDDSTRKCFPTWSWCSINSTVYWRLNDYGRDVKDHIEILDVKYEPAGPHLLGVSKSASITVSAVAITVTVERASPGSKECRLVHPDYVFDDWPSRSIGGPIRFHPDIYRLGHIDEKELLDATRTRGKDGYVKNGEIVRVLFLLDITLRDDWSGEIVVTGRCGLVVRESPDFAGAWERVGFMIFDPYDWPPVSADWETHSATWKTNIFENGERGVYVLI